MGTRSWPEARELWRGPRILGHRGASAHALENTLPAFERARADGADGVELDVHRCRSGELVVFHDAGLERLAGRPGLIQQLDWSELRQVELRGGGRIPQLDDVLDTLDNAALINVELKATAQESGRPLAGALADWLRKRRPGPRVLISSFHPLALLLLSRRQPDQPTGLLMGDEQARWLREGWSRHALRPFALHPQHTLLTPARVRRWRRQGYLLITWTVEGEGAVGARRRGAEVLISNDPGETRRLLYMAEGRG